MKSPDSSPQHRVLFVCMGNICRSPTAEAVFRKLVDGSRMAGAVEIDSAGTAGYHIGAKPDPRAIAVGKAKGYELHALRARQVDAEDFDKYDILVAMDQTNIAHLKEICPPGLEHKLQLLMKFAPGKKGGEVPDPYYGSNADFEHALKLI